MARFQDDLVIQKKEAAHTPAADDAHHDEAGAEHDPNQAKAAAITRKAMARKKGAQGEGSVQHKRDGVAQVQMERTADSDTASVHAAASHGIGGGGGALPHGERIQQSFGSQHDLSGVSAHVGGAAAEACGAMGASAYATGNHVAFQGVPDLHTVAHEAAHVVQQRAGVQLYGGVGKAGDAYESHADAVADRVVAGQPAGDLLAPFAGGGGTAVQRSEGAVQRQEAPAAPAGAAAGAGATAVQHYEVELKAWIPHSRVVDPEEPARISDWLDTISSVASTVAESLPGVSASLKYEYHSYYRGDGHTGYAGGYRVLSKASFDWDGKTISNFKAAGSYGASHRDYNYRAWFEVSAGIGPFRKTLGSVDITSGSNSESKTASSATSGASVGANRFDLGMASANPLVMTWAPTIDSELHGTLDASGNMALNFITDLFPSHGIQVSKDGSVIKSQVVNDPSGINALGPIGALDIGRRLTSHSNSGSTTAP